MRDQTREGELLFQGRCVAFERADAPEDEKKEEKEKEESPKFSSLVLHYLGKAAILYVLCLMVGIAVGAAYYSQAPEWFYDKEDAVTMVFVSGFGGFWLFWMVMDVANDVTKKFIKSKKWRYSLLFLVGYFIVYPSICKILFEEFVS